MPKSINLLLTIEFQILASSETVFEIIQVLFPFIVAEILLVSEETSQLSKVTLPSVSSIL